MSDTPDIYELEFKDIYEVVFDDVETTHPEGVAAATIEVAATPIHAEESAIALVGSTHVIESAATPINTALDSGTLAVAEAVEPTPTLETREVKVSVSPEMQTLVKNTIDGILNLNDKAIVSYAQLAQAVGTKLSSSKRKELIEAIRLDGRIEYFRDNCYLVIERSDKVMEAYQAGEDPLVDKKRITQLIEQLLPALKLGEGGHVHNKGVLGAIKGLGDFLTTEEKNEFFVQFYEHPMVRPTNDGNFFIDIPKAAMVEQSRPEPGTLTEDGVRPLGVEAKNGKSLSGRQVKKALFEIDGSEELRGVKDLAKRKANTRKKGRHRRKNGSRYQGKNHGKKKSLDQLIEEMNKPK